MHTYSSSLSLMLLATTVISCPDHSEYALRKRAEGQDWAYEASYNWGMIKEEYELCQTGTQQSPIPLLLTQGLSLTHRPSFNFPTSSNGTFHNWGYGPAFTLPSSDPTKNPSAIMEENNVNETIYLKGWHIHSPADHSVQGDRSKAELHFVFGTADGHERAVFAIRIDPGNTNSRFFAQLPLMVSFREKEKEVALATDNNLALLEVNSFQEFWTYKGSLTSPPCAEGIRWFVARNILFVSNDQMRQILGASTFSARAEQEVWLHGINV